LKGARAGAAAVGLGAGLAETAHADGVEPPVREVPTDLTAQCPYCGVGCGTLVQVSNGKVVGMKPDPKHSTNRGLQCVKGLTVAEAVTVDRLTVPLIRKDLADPLRRKVSRTKGRFDPDVWREASWEEAESLVAKTIASVVHQHGGNAVGLYGSGQLPIEAQWIENLFMKGIVGSNTIESTDRMGMSAAVAGLEECFGSDGPPTCYDDIELADMITAWGHNPRASHPVLYWRIAEHRSSKKIPTLVVDPRRTATVRGLEEAGGPEGAYHFSTINGDIALQNAIAHVLLDKHDEAVDWDLLKSQATGWQDYVAGVKERYAPEQVEHLTGVDPKLVRAVAARWADASVKGKKAGSGGVLSFSGMGLNQQLHGHHNSVSLINLMALSGNIGRPGCGPFPMTGPPNSMGQRLAGGFSGALPFHKSLKDPAWRQHIAEAWRLPEARLAATAKLENPGMAVGMMERALDGDVKVLLLVGATHIGLPDQHHLVRPALTNAFVVSQEIYRHAPNNLFADVVLPAVPWGEWEGGTFVNSERRLYVVDGTGNPIPTARPDLDISIDRARAVARELGLDPDRILPYRPGLRGTYDPEAVFRDIVSASKGSDADITGMLEVDKRDGEGLYEQMRTLRGLQWPAPTYHSAKTGGIARRYRGQERWAGKPYGEFAHPDGKIHLRLCEQTHDGREEIVSALGKAGVDPKVRASANLDLLARARDKAVTVELPDSEYLDKRWDAVPKDKFPFWLGLGVVYEHFHTAKTIRCPTNLRLVGEMLVEVNAADAANLGVADGDRVRVSTRRGAYEARVSIGLDSVVKPARNTVPSGYVFSPWNLSVADSAEPQANKWLVNGVTHRAFDPVSGQVDFKRLAARIEKLEG
jgi:anaerobic selenocysteine-containing dehydrogenase